MTNLDMILGKREDTTDEPYEVRFDPETGKPLFRHEDEDWIHVDRMVNGQRQKYVLSGADRRQSARAHARAEARQARTGQRAFARKRRLSEFVAGTRRMQLAILQDEVEVTPAMKANLITAMQNESRAWAKAQNAADDREMALADAALRLNERRRARFAAGQPRGKDLREDVFGKYAHLIPEGPFRARAERVMATS